MQVHSTILFRAMKNFLIAFTLILFISCTSNAKSNNHLNPLNQVPSEDDWSLPSSVQRSPNSGFYWVDRVPDADNAVFTWR